MKKTQRDPAKVLARHLADEAGHLAAIIVWLARINMKEHAGRKDPAS